MSDNILQKNRPVLLRPDNFTPATRTPWGGENISRLKNSLGVPRQPVGESWEFSLGPEFPSQSVDGRQLLAILEENGQSTTLLLKLLDARSALSLQIHPSDEDSLLVDDECGKPEAWYILHAKPGAGLYLGFNDGVNEEDVRECIHRKGDLQELMYFHPVKPGDVYRIDAHTAHAIGPGVTLLEPQRVVPGKKGVTYRYWDWNRRYDDNGQLDERGSPRPLHLEPALSVTDWKGARERKLLESIHAAGVPLGKTAAIRPLIGERGLPCDWLSMKRLEGSGELTIAKDPRPRSLTLLAGELTISGESIALGQSCLLLGNQEFRCQLCATHAVLCAA